MAKAKATAAPSKPQAPAAEAAPPAEASTGAKKGLIEVMVRKGRRVDHDGNTYMPGAKFLCTREERDRLAKLGAIVNDREADIPFGRGPSYGHENDENDPKLLSLRQ